MCGLRQSGQQGLFILLESKHYNLDTCQLNITSGAETGECKTNASARLVALVAKGHRVDHRSRALTALHANPRSLSGRSDLWKAELFTLIG